MKFGYSLLALLLIAVCIGWAATATAAGSNLQSIIDAANPGQTITVSPGTYEKITVKKSLKIIAEGAAIAAGGSEACISVEANDVTISGFTVTGGLYGIRLQNVRGCTITNNTAIYCQQPGIALLNSDDNLVAYNNASFNGIVGEGWYGIYLSKSSNNLVLNNVASGNGAYGVHTSTSCNNNTIRGNILERNMYGLYMFTDCANNLIEENRMTWNTNSGMDIRFNCHDNRIVNNTINDNVVAGVSLLKSGNNVISGNDIARNGKYGIQIQGEGGSNTVTSNSVMSSQTGIYLESSENQVFGNRFLDNVVQTQDRGSNQWTAPYPAGGNYWGDYAGEDSMGGPDQNAPGADGFGDSPYVIKEGTVDRYPVMGEQFLPIRLLDSSISPATAAAGEDVTIQIWLDSVNGISQISVRAPGASSTGYVRMNPTGDHYEGVLATALMEPGVYELVVNANDKRGYELEETIGQVEIVQRQGRDFQAAMSQLRNSGAL
ncbi:MAG: copper-binding protein [Methanosarcinales archaeon]|nr:copper-binding protein [Methanosarcinales archaeon]